MNRFSFALIVSLLPCVTSGCSQEHHQVVTIDGWQKSYEQFAVNDADGDLNFLRSRPDESGRRQFSIVGAKSPDESTDATGVLLGHRTIQNVDWSIFVLGVVNNRDISDIRIAMLSDEGDQPRWVMSRADSTMLQTYRRSHVSASHVAQSNGKPAISNFNGFPAEGDVFNLEVAGDAVSVTEKASSARWTVIMSVDGNKQGGSPGETRQVGSTAKRDLKADG